VYREAVFKKETNSTLQNISTVVLKAEKNILTDSFPFLFLEQQQTAYKLKIIPSNFFFDIHAIKLLCKGVDIQML
jgi:hypothetical protein